ncbi:MAG TPA: plasmid mobilization relaxosome protein MobC [Flavipsychrobacter sp.]|nr:plasmid mobilization relaxosome protein MobC [Flavipsychrobacter sp.]
MNDEQKKVKHKGGRPTKKIKRSSHLMVRLTETERFLIESKAKDAGLTPSEWFRQAAKKAKVVARLSAEDMKALRVLSGLANNVNQLARQANKEGLLTISRKCLDVLTETDDFLKYLNHDGEDR